MRGNVEHGSPVERTVLQGERGAGVVTGCRPVGGGPHRAGTGSTVLAETRGRAVPTDKGSSALPPTRKQTDSNSVGRRYDSSDDSAEDRQAGSHAQLAPSRGRGPSMVGRQQMRRPPTPSTGSPPKVMSTAGPSSTSTRSPRAQRVDRPSRLPSLNHRYRLDRPVIQKYRIQNIYMGCLRVAHSGRS